VRHFGLPVYRYREQELMTIRTTERVKLICLLWLPVLELVHFIMCKYLPSIMTSKKLKFGVTLTDATTVSSRRQATSLLLPTSLPQLPLLSLTTHLLLFLRLKQEDAALQTLQTSLSTIFIPLPSSRKYCSSMQDVSSGVVTQVMLRGPSRSAMVESLRISERGSIVLF
jgi:hypothetical protein